MRLSLPKLCSFPSSSTEIIWNSSRWWLLILYWINFLCGFDYCLPISWFFLTLCSAIYQSEFWSFWLSHWTPYCFLDPITGSALWHCGFYLGTFSCHILHTLPTFLCHAEFWQLYIIPSGLFTYFFFLFEFFWR
jgi:hypothetical protein